MSKKTRPQSSPVDRSSRGSGRGFLSNARRGAKWASKRKPDADTVPPEERTWKTRIRTYLPYIGIPTLDVILGIVAVCAATLLIGGWKTAYLPAAIGQTWFALHGVSLTIDGVYLSQVPLLPAIGIAALMAWRVRAATAKQVSILDLAVIAGLVIVLPLLASAMALFMVSDASAVFAIEPPPAWQALVLPPCIHLIGFLFGIRHVLWQALATTVRVPVVAVDTARAASLLLLFLCAGCGLVLLLVLAARYPSIGEAYAAYPNSGWGSAIMLLVLSILYLPNAVVGTLAVLLGGSFHVGRGEVSLFDVLSVPLPPFPLFAAIPATVAPWAAVLLVVPVTILCAFFVRRTSTMVEVAAIGSWSAAMFAVCLLLARGHAGAYGVVGADLASAVLFLFIWTVGVGGLVWLVRFVRTFLNRSHAEEE